MSNVLLTAKSAADRTEVLELKADPITSSLIFVDAEHSRIHAGRMFSLSGQMTLGAGVTAYLHGLTDSLNVHFRAASLVSTGAPISIALLENATVSNNGTPMIALNRKRSSTNTSALQVFSGPTVTNPGTALEYGLLPVIGQNNTGGIASMFASEWVLDLHNTSYLVRMTNNDNAEVTVNYNFLWYEA